MYIIPTTKALTLYDIEEHLLALIDTEELCSEELLAQHAEALAEAGETAVAKRDQSIQFVRHVESLIEFSRAEERRLADRRRSIEKGLARYQEYLTHIIEMAGTQTSPTIKRLKARLGDLCACTNPPALMIVDEVRIPAEYLSVSFTMPKEKWDLIAPEIMSYMPRDGATKSYRNEPETVLDRAAIKQALQSGKEVPGARLDSAISFRIK